MHQSLNLALRMPNGRMGIRPFFDTGIAAGFRKIFLHQVSHHPAVGAGDIKRGRRIPSFIGSSSKHERPTRPISKAKAFRNQLF
jgi:hypothetical protein